MRYFMDLEYNVSTHEVLSIGCINEEGKQFYTLVKSLNKIPPILTEITGITNKMNSKAPILENALILLYKYMRALSKEDEFYFYGDCDIIFLRRMRNCSKGNKELFDLCAHLVDNYVDYSVNVQNHFGACKLISLAKVSEYYAQDKINQTHNALDDAILLRTVYENVERDRAQDISRITEFPEYKKNNNAQKVKRLSSAGEVIEEYESMSKACNWLIDNYLKQCNKSIKVNDVRQKIKNAFNTNTSFVGYRWEIEK